MGGNIISEEVDEAGESIFKYTGEPVTMYDLSQLDDDQIHQLLGLTKDYWHIESTANMKDELNGIPALYRPIYTILLITKVDLTNV